MKPLEFVGDSLECLRQFPREARRQAGFQLQEDPGDSQSDLELAQKRYRELMKEQK